MIGIDIVEINRIKKALSSEHFVERVFSIEEISYQKKSRPKTAPQHFAGLFCAKEAAVKALGKSIFDYEIMHEPSGRPYLVDKKTKKKLKCEISISHCKEYATAIAIAT